MQQFKVERGGRACRVNLRRPRSNLKDARVANASMIMKYDRSRIASRAGRGTLETPKAIDRALALHLGIEIAP
jgi:hypothetical protein